MEETTEELRDTQRTVEIFNLDNPEDEKEVSLKWVKSDAGQFVMHNRRYALKDRSILGDNDVPKTSTSTPTADRMAKLEEDNRIMREQMEQLLKAGINSAAQSTPEFPKGTNDLGDILDANNDAVGTAIKEKIAKESEAPEKPAKKRGRPSKKATE